MCETARTFWSAFGATRGVPFWRNRDFKRSLNNDLDSIPSPALQLSRINHTSAESGVAYAETLGATNLPNWIEVGPESLVPHESW
jgi:hypothetical protein